MYILQIEDQKHFTYPLRTFAEVLTISEAFRKVHTRVQGRGSRWVQLRVLVGDENRTGL